MCRDCGLHDLLLEVNDALERVPEFPAAGAATASATSPWSEFQEHQPESSCDFPSALPRPEKLQQR